MRISPLALASLIGFACSAVPLHAESRFANPYDEAVAPQGLHFGNLEFAMPVDPLTPQADPGWEAHHTPARLMTDAASQIRAALPVGTSAARAEQILHAAGARCRAEGASALDCRYHDVETPYGGDYWDSVTWDVKLALAGGQVSDIAVTRDWSRH